MIGDQISHMREHASSLHTDNYNFLHENAPEIIGIIPSILWVFLVASLWLYFAPQIKEILPKLKNFEGLGISLTFFEEQFTQVMQARAPEFPATQAAHQLTQRLHKDGERLRNKRILWNDNTPLGNNREIQILEALDASVITKSSTEEALEHLKASEKKYDLILSNMTQEGSTTAATDLAVGCKAANIDTPIIAYIMNLDESKGTPAGLFGITNRPDELFHLIIDALSR